MVVEVLPMAVELVPTDLEGDLEADLEADLEGDQEITGRVLTLCLWFFEGL